jgi:hypothetical protein
MIVKELIEKLQTMDPAAVVEIETTGYGEAEFAVEIDTRGAVGGFVTLMGKTAVEEKARVIPAGMSTDNYNGTLNKIETSGNLGKIVLTELPNGKYAFYLGANFVGYINPDDHPYVEQTLEYANDYALTDYRLEDFETTVNAVKERITA